MSVAVLDSLQQATRAESQDRVEEVNGCRHEPGSRAGRRSGDSLAGVFKKCHPVNTLTVRDV